MFILMWFVEFCIVLLLCYMIFDDGVYETRCLFELKFIDFVCGDYGKEFFVEF